MVKPRWFAGDIVKLTPDVQFQMEELQFHPKKTPWMDLPRNHDKSLGKHYPFAGPGVQLVTSDEGEVVAVHMSQAETELS